ncbi:hypothetical protein SDC9_182598 [bioreactor metagenome]|uniref:Ammonia monooxygenase n=1 Tax=bioreactor metagenome TaxID=1076179 RepID=A0A645HHF8_9ZZZZ
MQHKVKTLSISAANSLIVILFTVGLSYLLMQTQGISATTGFLSLAPGGSDQMGIIAKVISADVSMVAGYQIFRILFINFFVPPSLKWFYRRYKKVKQSEPT